MGIRVGGHETNAEAGAVGVDGGRADCGDKSPRLRRKAAAFMALSASPIMTGMMGVSDAPQSQPMSTRVFFTWEARAITRRRRCGSRSTIRRAASDAAEQAGGRAVV